jgi:hypothetical protein
VRICLAKQQTNGGRPHDVLLLLKDIEADGDRRGADGLSRGATVTGARVGSWRRSPCRGGCARRAPWPRADAPIGFVSVLPAQATLTPGGAAGLLTATSSPSSRRTNRQDVVAFACAARRRASLPETGGLPFWSPDSRRQILRAGSEDDQGLRRRAADARKRTARGAAPGAPRMSSSLCEQGCPGGYQRPAATPRPFPFPGRSTSAAGFRRFCRMVGTTCT